MVDLDTDPFIQLLTDALRAGPHSPQWQDAVARLRSNGSTAGDEYQLLLDAREHLEKGREYRKIHAGVGFTRKLMEGIDEQEKPGRRRGFPIAALIAVLASIAIALGLGWLGYHLAPRSVNGRGMVDDLANTYFPTIFLNTDFSTAAPAGWRPIGKLALDNAGGLKPAAGDELAGGGLVIASPLAADEPFAVEADLRLTQPSDKIIAQLFVSSADDFSADRGTSSRELVWNLHGKSEQVVLNEHVLPVNAAARPDGVIRVRIIVNRELAVVEAGGQRLWAGPHELGPNPRWLGVRFIRGGGGPNGGIVVKSIRVLKR